MCLPTYWWVIYKHTCPYPAECSADFDQKWHDPLPLHFTLCIHLISPHTNLFPQLKKVLKGKHFADVEQVKQKKAKALKASKSMSSKTVLRGDKKHLDRCVASNGEYFEGD